MKNKRDTQIIISERCIVRVRVKNESYKLFQIFFGKKDRSVFVNFPYYNNTKGLVSLAMIPKNINFPFEITLLPGGKVTSHLVKYSHHPDGRIHFSQSGKVFTKIKKNSIPLSSVDGHMFTVHLQGINDFQKVAESKSKKNDCYVEWFFPQEPKGIKIVGHLYSRKQSLKRIRGEVIGPKILCEAPNGDQYIGFLLTHPFQRDDADYVIIVTCCEAPAIDKDNHSALVFLGGFDCSSIVNDHSQDTTFLAMHYPMVNYEELKNQIGSIDLELGVTPLIL